MKITKFAAATAMGLICFAGQASAMDGSLAQLGSVTGSVAVNQGGKVVAATNATTLRAGDKLVTTSGSTAQIKFADGCTVALKANAVATVGAQSPCSASAGLVKTSNADQFGLNGFWGAAAIFAVGTILLVAYAGSKDNDFDPLSP